MSAGAIERGEAEAIVEQPAGVVLICDDWSVEREGFYRAYTSDSLDAATMCTLHGYVSGQGTFRTIREAAADARRLCPGWSIYRYYRTGLRKARELTP